MSVSFDLVVAFVIAVDWTCLGCTQLWHWFIEVTARLWTQLNSSVKSCCLLGAGVMLSHFVFRVVPLLSCNCPVARGPVSFVSPTQGSRLPLEHQSLQGLLFSLRCWNLLCTSNPMAIRKESHFYCCHLDHPKPPSRTSFIRKYSKHYKSQILCLL